MKETKVILPITEKEACVWEWYYKFFNLLTMKITIVFLYPKINAEKALLA